MSVTAPALFGQLHVAPLVTTFLERHERVRARLLLVDALVRSGRLRIVLADREPPERPVQLLRLPGSLSRAAAALSDHLSTGLRGSDRRSRG